MPPLRVLHVTTDYRPGTGGLETFVHDLAARSASIGVTASVLGFNRIAGSPDRLPAEDVTDGVPVRRVGFLDLKYYKPTVLPLALLRSADVLHVHGLGGHLDFVAASAPLHRRPIVLSTHGGIFHTDTLATAKRAYFALVRRWVLPRVTRVVACGAADRAAFAARGVPGLLAIDNGVDLSPFAALGPADDAAREPLRLLYVGRLAANKAVDDLLRTVAELRRTGTPATLRVVGPDRAGLGPGLVAVADGLGVAASVAFVGRVSAADLLDEYRRADAFVSASRHEGFGISAVEAMAAGLPAVLNDIPAFSAVLGDAAAGGLVDFTDPPAAAAAVQRWTTGDRSAARAAARTRAAAFGWDRVLPAWRGIYGAAATARPRKNLTG